MTQHATVTDHITYRPGDGAPLVIPLGPLEVELTADTATLSWTEDNGAAGLTAIPLTQYNEYVSQKRITPANPSARQPVADDAAPPGFPGNPPR